MDGSLCNTSTATDILRALSDTEALEDLRGILSEDFDGTLIQLEKIPAQVIRIITSGTEENGMPLDVCMRMVNEVVEKILQKRYQSTKDASLERIAKKLSVVLTEDALSPKSLNVLCAYLKAFQKKYPPRYRGGYEDGEGEEETHHHYTYDDYMALKHDPIDGHYISEDDVREEEKATLGICVQCIKRYTAHLYTRVVKNPSPEEKKRCIETESAQINIMKEIMDIIRDMLDWGDKYDPYVLLRAPGEVFENNRKSVTIFDAVTGWECIVNGLKNLKKK